MDFFLAFTSSRVFLNDVCLLYTDACIYNFRMFDANFIAKSKGEKLLRKLVIPPHSRGKLINIYGCEIFCSNPLIVVNLDNTKTFHAYIIQYLENMYIYYMNKWPFML